MKKPKEMITPDLVLEMISRRRWFVLIPFITCMIIGSCVVIILPKIYEAKTLILVEPQRVPSDYVRSLVTQDINIRVRTVRHQILSRTNLEKIIQEFELFDKPEQKGMYIEDKLESLRTNIVVDLTTATRGADVFSISFRGKDRIKVMRVANSLASYFIDENLRVRESQAIGTSDFLDEELSSMKEKLVDVENTLEQYSKKYMGELPEQLQTNLGILNRLQQRLSDRQQNMRDEKMRLVSLENQMNIAQSQIESTGGVIEVVQEPDLSQQTLENMRNQLNDLKSRYTERHPDVLRLESSIKNLEFEIEHKTKKPTQVQESLAIEENPVIVEYKRQASEIQHGLQSIENEINDLLSQVAIYEKRVENTPKREQELLSLKRDHQNIEGAYNSLLSRKLESEIAVNMEKRQKGEQFKIVDRAKIPEKPVAPDLIKIFFLFIAAGFGLGGGLILLFEYLDTSFRTPEDFESFVGLPIICTVPRLIHKKEKRFHVINNILTIAFVGLSFVSFACFFILSYKGVDQTFEFINKLISRNWL